MDLQYQQRERVVSVGKRRKGKGRENESFNTFFTVEILRARTTEILDV